MAAAFGRAADDYHRAADVQRDVAARLARRVAAVAPRPSPRLLEIGCGTGFVYRALSPHLPGAWWLLSDLSEAMVRRARAEIGGGAATFAVLDGERTPFAPASFDVVCASLV